jgi:hypothetical protein
MLDGTADNRRTTHPEKPPRTETDTFDAIVDYVLAKNAELEWRLTRGPRTTGRHRGRPSR